MVTLISGNADETSARGIRRCNMTSLAVQWWNYDELKEASIVTPVWTATIRYNQA